MPKRPVCGYFLLGNSRETRLTVSRLQTAHVVVDRLAHRTVVPDFRPYGDAPRRRTLPAGTYWISLAQAQKHWVQATLNEDTYVPFPYFYDVSGWSLPLLAGIPGGSTGRHLHASVVRVPKLRTPATPRPRRVPRIAVLDQWKNTANGYQYSGWLKWRLAQDWRFPYQVLLPKQINAKTLRRFDVLVVGNVDSSPVFHHLGAQGQAALSTWVHHGGRYVGWQEGALLASALGISQVGMLTPETTSPGAMMRIRTPHGPNEIEWDSDYNLVLAPGAARVVGSFPQAHVRLRVRHEEQDPRRHGPRDRREGRPWQRDGLRLRAQLPRRRRRLGPAAQASDPPHAHRLGALDDARADGSEAAVGRAEPHPHPSLASGPRQPGVTPA